jgi:hypothetical protein
MATCSNCVLTTGFEQNCLVKPIGGNLQNVYILPTCLIDEYVEEYNDRVITDIVFDPSVAGFYEVTAIVDTVSVQEQVNQPNRPVNQTISFQLSPFADAATNDEAFRAGREFVQQLIDSVEPMTIITRGRDQRRRILGAQLGLDMSEFNDESGATKEDTPTRQLTFSGIETEVAYLLAEDYEIPVETT